MKPSRKQLTEWARQAAQAEYARYGVQCRNSPRGHSLEWQDGGYCDYCGDHPEVEAPSHSVQESATSFDKYFEQRMTDPQFAQLYYEALAALNKAKT